MLFTDVSSNPIALGLFFMLLGLVPFMFLALTSFLKISVVLAILRNALGAGGVPSAAISAVLALALSLHIMYPVFKDVAGEAGSVLKRAHLGNKSSLADVPIYDTFNKAKLPLERFLVKHANRRERAFFANIQKQRLGMTGQPNDLPSCQLLNIEKTDLGIQCRYPGESLFSIVPAFVLSELKSAFFIGFAIFLPFLVVDLVVTNVLVGLGMMMVSPATVSLPFKLLLFILTDAWFLLSKGLVLSYAV